MNRRTFIEVIAGGLLAAPLAAEAQQAGKVARIGYLATNLAGNPHGREAFRQGLRDLGYVEGRTVVIEYRSAEEKIERFPALAAELVGLKVDVILTGSTAGATVTLASSSGGRLVRGPRHRDITPRLRHWPPRSPMPQRSKRCRGITRSGTTAS